MERRRHAEWSGNWGWLRRWPSAPVNWSGVAAFLAFGGFDQIAAVDEEVMDQRRTLPAAIMLSPLAVLLLYVGLLWACLGNVSPEGLAASPAPLALAAGLPFYAGPGACPHGSRSVAGGGG